MATTIKLKNGSGAPLAGDLVAGEPALDLTNKRLYTEDSGGTVIEVGTNPGASGAVTLNYSGSAKLATTATGIDVTGIVVADGLESSGGLTFTAADGIEIAGKESIVMRIDSDDNDANRVFNVVSGSSGSQETLISASEDAGVSLYYDNSAKLATTSTGIDVTGTTVTDGLTSAGDAAITGSSSGSTVLTLTSNALADTPLIVFQRDGGAVAGKLAYEDTNTAMAFGTTTSHELKLLANNTRAIQIDSGGDISFYEDTGTTAKLFWDASAESLGIGTDNPLGKLAVEDSGTGSEIVLSRVGAAAGLYARVGWTGANGLDIGVDNGNVLSASHITMSVDGSEAIRIDSSGNWLVGKTSANNTSQGTTIYGATAPGAASFVRDSGNTLVLNRLTNDGEIVAFRKDGSEVGSIATWDSDFAIGQVNVAFKFDDGGNQILPWSVDTNLNRDAAVDLGDSTSRWKNLYLSGGVYLGGTGTANKLDDYEEGTWTPIASRFSGGEISATYETRSGNYVKVGNVVTINFFMKITAITGQGSSLTRITGIPFNPADAYYNNGVVGDNSTPSGNAPTRLTVHTDGSLYFRDGQNNITNITTDWTTGQISGSVTYIVA